MAELAEINIKDMQKNSAQAADLLKDMVNMTLKQVKVCNNHDAVYCSVMEAFNHY